MMSTIAVEASSRVVRDAEVQEAEEYLRLTRDGVARAVAGLSDAQWRFTSAPPRWSIHEVVEHLAVMEELFHGQIVPRLVDGPAVVRTDDPRPMDDLVRQWEPDPAAKVVIPGRVSLGDAPPQLAPTRRWDPRESLQRFSAIRERTIEFLLAHPGGLRDRAVEHPALGPLDGYQWVLFIAAHSARHTAQILGVLADPGLPKPLVETGTPRTTI